MHIYLCPGQVVRPSKDDTGGHFATKQVQAHKLPKREQTHQAVVWDGCCSLPQSLLEILQSDAGDSAHQGESTKSKCIASWE